MLIDRVSSIRKTITRFNYEPFLSEFNLTVHCHHVYKFVYPEEILGCPECIERLMTNN
ncbi:MAG: hypothetical protein REH83_04360 [Rickettsiella sp.]|nr:hypothetical protein [Rickettsiella sp.]